MEAIQSENNIEIRELFSKIIEKSISRESYLWLSEKAKQLSADSNTYQLNLAFTMIPRKTGKQEVILEESSAERLQKLMPGFSIQHWTADRLSRVWLLMNLDTSDKEEYIQKIEKLFPQAEMNEQVALYAALPVLAYPEYWKMQCAVGIRSSLDSVLKAIMYHNPYPAANLEELAWNQMVMKAFFSGLDVNKIVGIDERANQALAATLFDYVEERWAASRAADPQIWRMTAKFMDEPHFYMIERLFSRGNEAEKEAAALTCASGSFAKARTLLNNYPEYKKAVDEGKISWKTVADKR